MFQSAIKLEDHSTIIFPIIEPLNSSFSRLTIHSITSQQNSHTVSTIMAMETDAAASFSRLTLISNFGPPPPPASNPPPLSNGHSMSQSHSINSAMSLETNEDVEDNGRTSGVQMNGHTRKVSGTSADEGEVTYEMEEREDDDGDGIYTRNNKFAKSLSSEESKKPVVHGK
jgi:hypothetical protein